MYCSDGAACGHKIKVEAQLVGAEIYNFYRVESCILTFLQFYASSQPDEVATLQIALIPSAFLIGTRLSKGQGTVE